MFSHFLIRSSKNLCGKIRRCDLVFSRLNSQNVTKKKSLTNLTNSTIVKFVAVGSSLALLGGGTYYAYKKKIYSKIEKIAKPNIPDLPSFIPYLIVGSGTAAHAASRSIRARDPFSKVIMVPVDSFAPYSKNPIVLTEEDEKIKNSIFKSYPGKDRTLFYEKEGFYLTLKELQPLQNGGVALIKNAKITKIDTEEQIAYFDNGQKIKYGKCLLATGGKTKKLKFLEDFKTWHQNKIIYLPSLKDYSVFKSSLDLCESVVVLGGSFLANELSLSLINMKTQKGNLKVIQLTRESGVLWSILPKYLSHWLTEKIKKEGVDVVMGEIQKCDFDRKLKKVIIHLTNGKKINTDLMILAVGISPNVDIATESKLEIDPNNKGVMANGEFLVRTNLWAAGNMVSFYDEKFGRRRLGHHDHDVITGRLAGQNMTGNQQTYWNQSMIWSDLGTFVGLEGVGVLDSNLETVSLFQKDSDENKYDRGIVLYKKNGNVVGILLWNIFNKIHIARQIIKDNIQLKEVTQYAKLFQLYPEPEK